MPPGTTRVLLPGYCQGELDVGRAGRRRAGRARAARPAAAARVLRPAAVADDYGAYDIEILAEINHAPRLPLAEILAEAAQLRADGADLIDVGCDPGETWSGVGEAVRRCATPGIASRSTA